MAQFKYKARKKSGETIEGIIEAENESDVLKELAGKDLFVSSITKKEEEDQEEEKVLFKEDIFAHAFSRIKLSDLAWFAAELATLQRSGLPIIRSFEILVAQAENPRFKDILLHISNDIQAGQSLSSALEKYPKIFSRLYINSVKVGEETGTLEEILDSIALFLEKEADLRTKVRSAMSYPIVLFLTALLVVFFLVTFVFPKFKLAFKKAKVSLPLPTEIIFNVGEMIMDYWYIIFAVAAGIIFAVISYIKTPHGRFVFDSFKLKIPLIGSLVRKVAISRFTRSLEILIRSGINILTALDIAKENVVNARIEREVDRAANEIKKGGKISAALSQSKEFPEIVIQLISVGEETGSLEKSLKQITDEYDKRIDYTVKNLTTLLEPFIIIVIAGMIVFIALSLFLPIFNMMDALG